MRTKRKISVTIDEEILNGIEKASKAFNMAKSQVAQEAFRWWLKRKTEESMARGYMEMAKEDRALSEITFEAQKEVLS